MSARTIIRAAMVGIALLVVVVVVTSWEGRPELPVEEELDGAVTPDDEPDLVATTEGLRHVANVNGVIIYEVSAAEAVSRTGNRSEYSGGVELILYEHEGGEVRVTRVSGQRMSLIERPVAIEGDAYEEVRIMGEVRAILPDGVEVLSDVITYSGGGLFTDSGVLVRAADLVLEASTLHYDPEYQEGLLTGSHPDSLRPELNGPVRLWSEAADGAGPRRGAGALQVDGWAGDMLFNLRDSELVLRDGPSLSLEEALLSGWEIALGLDQVGGRVDSMLARVDARAAWLGATAPGDHVVSGDLISVQLVDETPDGLQVTHDVEAGGPRPRFQLGDSGELRADRFDLGFGEAAAIEATGQAYFFPSANDARLEHIGAERLTAGGGELDELTASGDVEVLLAGEEGAMAFRGPRAVLAYGDGDIAAAEWPEGIRHEAEDGSEVTAGRGSLDPDTGNWVLDGEPRPRFRSTDFDVEAGSIVLLPNGGIDLYEEVSAQLRGDLVSTIGPLFGGAPEIEASSDALQVRDGNRLTFSGDANIWQGVGDYRMRADEIRVLAPSNELRAGGDVFISLVDSGRNAGGNAEQQAGDREDPQADAEAEQEAGEGAASTTTVVMIGALLLVEGQPLGLVMSGDSLLELVESSRTIGGDRILVSFGEDGGWDAMEVVGGVVMQDSAGTGEGERLEYRSDSDLIVIYAGESKPATFLPEGGMEIRDGEGLRLSFDGDNLRVNAMQNGTTQTVRRGG